MHRSGSLPPGQHVPSAPGDPADLDSGGDAACWAHRVCPTCGRLAGEERPVVCGECGSAFPEP